MASGTKNLLGKVALVTGGSRGLGAAIARRLGGDGAAVALTYSASPDRAKEVVARIEATGGKALAINADSAIARIDFVQHFCPCWQFPKAHADIVELSEDDFSYTAVPGLAQVPADTWPAEPLLLTAG